MLNKLRKRLLINKCRHTKGTLEVMENTLFDRTFKDTEGNIVLAQPPNLPIIVWGIASLLQLVVTSGETHTGLDLIAFGSSFTWTWEETFQGVNYFRRALGWVVLIAAIAFRIQTSGE